ncbi:MAG: hypothetical protein ACRD2Z_08740 [Thermoanaerobaculia bacterium]
MRHRAIVGIAALLMLVGIIAATPAQAAEKRLGFGVHYWRTVDDIDDEGLGDIEDDGVSYLGSYQILPGGLLSFEFDLEYFEAGFGGSEDAVFSPQAFLLVGHGLYAGVGVGVGYSDGFEDDVSDPFYIARVGFNMELLPKLFLDINANYQANAFSELDQADTDAITLGALLRFGLGGSR